MNTHEIGPIELSAILGTRTDRIVLIQEAPGNSPVVPISNNREQVSQYYSRHHKPHVRIDQANEPCNKHVSFSRPR